MCLFLSFSSNTQQEFLNSALETKSNYFLPLKRVALLFDPGRGTISDLLWEKVLRIVRSKEEKDDGKKEKSNLKISRLK